MEEWVSMTDRDLTAPAPQAVSGRSARFAATLFNLGSIVAVAVPPLTLLWLGASMLVYAMNRHHPNPKVGYYTQQAAYRFYGVAGTVVIAAAFIPGGGWQYYLLAWAVAAAIIIPWSVWDLVRIFRDDWQDVQIEEYEDE
jgi:hypothetical protein